MEKHVQGELFVPFIAFGFFMSGFSDVFREKEWEHSCGDCHYPHRLTRVLTMNRAHLQRVGDL